MIWSTTAIDVGDANANEDSGGAIIGSIAGNGLGGGGFYGREEENDDGNGSGGGDAADLI